MNQSDAIEEQNKYGIEIWLLDALKAYDPIMTDEVRRKDTIRTMKAKRKLQSVISTHFANELKKQAKAYGGCTRCYGKGYATVNEYSSGHGTDGDIGGFVGRIKFKNNPIKPCICDRGDQITKILDSFGGRK